MDTNRTTSRLRDRFRKVAKTTSTFGATPSASSELVLVHPSTASGPTQTSASANAELSVVP